MIAWIMKRLKRSTQPLENDRLELWEELPLGLALIAQSYVVGLWYFASVKGASARIDLFVAIGAGLALDLIVVTTVMGRRAGRSSGWSWLTALGAFGCSALIAMDRYGWEYRSLLHVAFPLVVFLYSQHLATPRKRSQEKISQSKTDTTENVSVPLTEQNETEEPSLAPSRIPGFVYIFSSPNGYKIGCSKNVDRRKQQLSASLPFQIDLVHTITSPDMYATEGRLHTYYTVAQKHISGEWFALTSIDLSTLKTIADSDIDQALDQALHSLANAGVKDREMDSAFWLQQATAKKTPALEQSASEQLIARLLDEALESPKRMTIEELEALTAIVLPDDAQAIGNGHTLRVSGAFYECPHCRAPVKSKQARGAAFRNGYCLTCKGKQAV